MSYPTSRLAYAKYFEAYDRAANSRKGIRLEFDSIDDALFFRARMHQARKIDRKGNLDIYQPGDALYGCSTYDTFTVKHPVCDTDGKWWLYVERNDVLPNHIEELEDDE